MAMVENAERQILTVIDMEHKQLVLRNLFDVLDICALVMQIYIDAVYSQTNAVAVDCLHNFQCLTHAVAAPFLITNRLKGQLDAIRFCDVCELIEHLYGVVKYFLLVLGADFRRYGRNNDDIRVSNLLCNFTAKGKQFNQFLPLLLIAEIDVFNRVEGERLQMALGKECLEVFDRVGLKIVLEHIEPQLDIIVSVLFAKCQIFFCRRIFLTGSFVVAKF